MADSVTTKLAKLEARLEDMEEDYKRKIALKDLRIDDLLVLIAQLNNRVQYLEQKCNIPVQSMQIDLLAASNNTSHPSRQHSNTSTNSHTYNRSNTSRRSYASRVSVPSKYTPYSSTNASKFGQNNFSRNNINNSNPTQIDWTTLQDCDTDQEDDYCQPNGSNDPINDNTPYDGDMTHRGLTGHDNTYNDQNRLNDNDNGSDDCIKNAMRDMNPLFDSTYFEVTRARNRSGRDTMESRYIGENSAAEGEDDTKTPCNKNYINDSEDDIEDDVNQDHSSNKSFKRSLANYTSIPVNSYQSGEHSDNTKLQSLIFNQPFIQCGFDMLKIDCFDNMGLEDNLLRGIFAYGFEKPSRIQLTCIPPIMKGRDIIMQERSGCGKTAAYLIPICNKIYSDLLHQSQSKQSKQSHQSKTPTNENISKKDRFSRKNLAKANNAIPTTSPGCQCVIIAPSRELCSQIARVARFICTYMDSKQGDGIECNGIEWIELIGGSSVRQDIRSLNTNKCHGVIGTYGRIQDMLNRGVLNLSNLKAIIVDDFDGIIQNKHFINFLDQLIAKTNNKNKNKKKNKNPKQQQQKVQKVFVTTTMSNKSYNITKNWIDKDLSSKDSKDPLMQCLEVLVGDKNLLSAADIGQHKFELVDMESNDIDKCFVEQLGSVLMNEFNKQDTHQCLVFVNSNCECDFVKELLKQYFDKFRSENVGKIDRRLTNVTSLYVNSIHDDMTQMDRELVVKEFRSGSCRLLITTDVMTRGIDIHECNLVITTIPNNIESFVNRVGRCGRYGRFGKVLVLANGEEKEYFEKLAGIFGISRHDWNDYKF